MEIKTKFDIGQTVWYVDYKGVVHNDCPVCCNEIEECVPIGVSHGEIRERLCAESKKDNSEIQTNKHF